VPAAEASRGLAVAVSAIEVVQGPKEGWEIRALV